MARSKDKALGKGLAALIGEGKLAEGGDQGRLRELPVADIAVSRRQPRHTFAADELQELAESVRHLGLVQPVVVRPLAGGDVAGSTASAGPRFELIAGERRLRAAKMAGMQSVPALIRPADDVASLEIALAENVAREDLNGIEEAHAYAALVDEFGITHERIAELVGRSRVAVTNVLRLLELPDDVQAMIEGGELSEGHARALLGVPGHEERRKVARAGREPGADGAPDGGARAQARRGGVRRRAAGGCAGRPGRGAGRLRRGALRRARSAGAYPGRHARRQDRDPLQGPGRARAPDGAAARPARLRRCGRRSASPA